MLLRGAGLCHLDATARVVRDAWSLGLLMLLLKPAGPSPTSRRWPMALRCRCSRPTVKGSSAAIAHGRSAAAGWRSARLHVGPAVVTASFQAGRSSACGSTICCAGSSRPPLVCIGELALVCAATAEPTDSFPPAATTVECLWSFSAHPSRRSCRPQFRPRFTGAPSSPSHHVVTHPRLWWPGRLSDRAKFVGCTIK
jgi:hypothetical protein